MHGEWSSLSNEGLLTLGLAWRGVQIALPNDFEMPPGGLSIRWPDPFLATEARMQDYKIYAAMAYARQNRLNRVTIDAAQARLGIVASGKSYLDVLEALEELGIDEGLAASIGIRLFKVAMPWPLEKLVARMPTMLMPAVTAAAAAMMVRACIGASRGVAMCVTCSPPPARSC